MKVSVSSAATIIVLASEETASQSDARVLRIVLMLMSIHAQLVQATEAGFPVSGACRAADCTPACTSQVWLAGACSAAGCHLYVAAVSLVGRPLSRSRLWSGGSCSAMQTGCKA